MSEEVRPREVLAKCWRDEGRPELADTIAAGKDSEWSKSAVAIKAMLAFAAPLETAARTLIAKLDECAPHVSDAFLHRELRCGPYEGPNYAVELAALRDLVEGDGK